MGDHAPECSLRKPNKLIEHGPLAGTAIAPFAQMLGIEVREADEGRVVMVLPATDLVANRRGKVHGGALATMVDSAMALATRSLDPGLTMQGTVDLNLHFIRPGEGQVTARARVRHLGGSLSFCECEVIDDSGELVATAMASFKVRRGGAAR